MKIAIASGKGGTGKTFVSTNLFYLMREKGMSVSAVDCDAEVPNLSAFFPLVKHKETEVMQYRPSIKANKCNFCGKCVEYCVFNAIFMLPETKTIRLLDDLCHGCAACQTACSQQAIKEISVKVGKVGVYKLDNKKIFVEGKMETGQSSPVPVIKTAIKLAESLKTSYILMDAPAGTSCPFIQTVAQADHVILVTEPTPFGLSDLKQAVESLKIMDKNFSVIINRAGLGNREVYSYLETENIPLLAEIPFDKEIASWYSQGIVVAEQLPFVKHIFEDIIIRLNQDGNSIHKR